MKSAETECCQGDGRHFVHYLDNVFFGAFEFILYLCTKLYHNSYD